LAAGNFVFDGKYVFDVVVTDKATNQKLELTGVDK
jgi:hypothetical protein